MRSWPDHTQFGFGNIQSVYFKEDGGRFSGSARSFPQTGGNLKNLKTSNNEGKHWRKNEKALKEERFNSFLCILALKQSRTMGRGVHVHP
jgi:hypothetical protein